MQTELRLLSEDEALEARRHLRALERDGAKYVDEFTRLDPHSITPEQFADLQALATDFDDSRRKIVGFLQRVLQRCEIGAAVSDPMFDPTQIDPEPPPMPILPRLRKRDEALQRRIVAVVIGAFICGISAGIAVALLFR